MTLCKLHHGGTPWLNLMTQPRHPVKASKSYTRNPLLCFIIFWIAIMFFVLPLYYEGHMCLMHKPIPRAICSAHTISELQINFWSFKHAPRLHLLRDLYRWVLELDPSSNLSHSTSNLTKIVSDLRPTFWKSVEWRHSSVEVYGQKRWWGLDGIGSVWSTGFRRAAPKRVIGKRSLENLQTWCTMRS